MAKKKVNSVFRDLYPEDQAAEMEMRSLLLQGLGSWLANSGMTQTEAAMVLENRINRHKAAAAANVNRSVATVRARVRARTAGARKT